MSDSNICIGEFDARASITIGPLTIYEDGDIKVKDGTPPGEVASLLMSAVVEYGNEQRRVGAQEERALDGKIEFMLAPNRIRGFISSLVSRGLMFSASQEEPSITMTIELMDRDEARKASDILTRALVERREISIEVT